MPSAGLCRFPLTPPARSHPSIMDIRTHRRIDHSLCGSPVDVSPGHSTVRLTTTEVMSADERGLVHGGFIFGMADHAAMLAVNDPYVVLGSAETRFIAPVRVGETLEARAAIDEKSGSRHQVNVTVRHQDNDIFTGRFTCFTPDHHVFDR